MLFYALQVRLLGISSTCMGSFCLDNTNVVIQDLVYFHNYRESLIPKARTQMTFHWRFKFDGKKYFAFQKYEYSLSEVRWEDHNIEENIKIFKDIVLGLEELKRWKFYHGDLSPYTIVKKKLDSVWLLYGVTCRGGSILDDLFNLGIVILVCDSDGQVQFEDINPQNCKTYCDTLLSSNKRHIPELYDLVSCLFEKRLDADEAMKHPAFRSEMEQLRFMSNLSDNLQSDIPLRDQLETLHDLVYDRVKDGLIMHADFVRAMVKYVDYRNFGCNTAQGLIKMMRNTIHHLKVILERKPHLRPFF